VLVSSLSVYFHPCFALSCVRLTDRAIDNMLEYRGLMAERTLLMFIATNALALCCFEVRKRTYIMFLL